MSPLPDSVLKRLAKSSFVHLGTSLHDVPHVSLMNYTFIGPDDRFNDDPQDLILLATNKDTTKYRNLASNPRCSILLHDWVSDAGKDGTILGLLQSINHQEVSELSCTLKGHVYEILDVANQPDKFNYYKKLHLVKNPSASAFTEGADVVLLLIQVDGSEVADASNNISQYN